MVARSNIVFAWLWLSTLLVSTVGVNVHSIYCYCVGRATVEFCLPVERCNVDPKADADDDCCAKTEHDCCKNSEVKSATHTKGCMTKSSRFFQLKTEFTAESSFAKVLDFQVVALPAAPVFFQKSCPPALLASTHFKKAPPPPARSGQQIRRLVGSFRC